MRIHFHSFVLFFLLALAGSVGVWAQDGEPAGDEDGSSEQVESAEDAYRRRMELEDARRKDPSYTDPVDTYKKDLEKIDKLPEESRENIRDQLVDVIMENGEWEPSDALEEYPYEPTEGAQSDPVLMEQEQEAWEEQIEKYHEREAAAFGAYRGPVPGPGNPTGQEGGSQGSEQGQQGGQQGQQGGQGGSSGQDGDGGSGSEGTYEPYQSSHNGADDEVSTAGVSESALDFLKGRQGQQQPSGSQQQAPTGQQQADSMQAEAEAAQQAQAEAAQQAQAEAAQQAQAEAAQQAEAEAAQQAQAEAAQQAEAEAAQQAQAEAAEQEQSEQQQDSTPEIDLDTRGIIAIKDLDKLEGADSPEQPPPEEDP